MTLDRKRILITIPRMPFPLNSGGRIAIYDALSLLSKKYNLTLVIIDDCIGNEKYVCELSKFSDKIHFFSRPRYQFVLNALLGLFSGKPLQVGYFYFKHVQKLVNKLALENDAFYAFMIRTTDYGLNLNLKKGHYAIDSMYLNYTKSKEKTTSLLWKIIYKIELPLLFKTEANQIKNYDITTFVNKEEAEFWKSYGNVDTLPHGVVEEILHYNNFDNKYSNVVAFIGRMDYQPNIEAVLWFSKNVLTNLSSGIEFWIIGGYPTHEIKSLADKYNNVRVLGFVDDPYIILRSCICTVAPMQSGGGLQTKILMAMAVESLVVCSSLPISAIEGAQNDFNLIVEDNPEKMGKIINDIYSDPIRFLAIKKAGKELVLESYSLSKIESKLYSLVDNNMIL